MTRTRLTAWILLLCLLAVAVCGCGEGDTPPADTSRAASDTASEPTASLTEPTVPVSAAPEPENPTVLTFLKTAVMPVGSTMYIWGGGWNEADTGAGTEAVTLGVSPEWGAFADAQTADYDHKAHRYQIHRGLDCSGYVGWAVYNTLETENGGEGYVVSSTVMAQTLGEKGLGTYIPRQELTRWCPGDIMSRKGHVWISLGMCDDGSVLLLHASPPGVRFCGTVLPDGSPSQAVVLAEKIMSTRYPDWYARYPQCDSSYRYLEESSAMRWSAGVLPDPEGIGQMSAPAVVKLLFPETDL